MRKCTFAKKALNGHNLSMASPPPIRSVQRALDVLLALNRNATCTLDQLHKQTDLPKPTLIRLLETLKTKNMVVSAQQYGSYSLSSGVKELSSGYHGEPRIVQASIQAMDELTNQFKWPLALAIPDYDAVVIRYSTIPKSPLALLHSSVNMRLSLVSRALGNAYLAFSSQEEYSTLLDVLQHSSEPEDEIAKDRKNIDHIRSEVLNRGYAVRRPGVRPVSNTMAVPIFDHSRVVASLGLTWISSALTISQAETTFLDSIYSTAKRIEDQLHRI
jgi:IclR family mhp operon transcriptional activator